jgi:CheY-like chemotaxis protein
MIGEIKKAGDRAARLVRQLLVFSRKQELVLAHLDLRAVVEDVKVLLQRIIGENIRMTLHTTSDPMVIKADRSQLEQVMMNLVTNARDAMPSGGSLRIELSAIDVTDETIGVDRLEPGRYALLSVADTGKGMDDETLAHAFDPFFTTKDVDRGTGLGLATVYGIAKGSGGTVQLTSSPGLGTTAKVFFPLSMEGTIDVLPVPSLPTTGGKETILVVEDEPAVSNLELRILRDAGYEVLFAPNGERALEVFLLRAKDIHLVLTDVVMPLMGGPELVRRIHAAGYRPKVLFASGYTNNSIANLGSLAAAVDLLEKPFSTKELVGRVRLALDRTDTP